MRAFFFYLSTATLLTHELDAVKHSEWGLLYILRDLPSTTAYTVFVLLHVPLIALILWLSHHRNFALRSASRILICVFTIGHAMIHLRLDGTDNYFFEGWLADGLIYGAAAFGMIYCFLVLVERVRGDGTKAS